MGHSTRDLLYRYDPQESKYRQQPQVHIHSPPQPSSRYGGRQDVTVDNLRSRDYHPYSRDGRIYQPSHPARTRTGKSEADHQSSQHAALQNSKTYTIEESKAKPKRFEYPTHRKETSASPSKIIASTSRIRPRHDTVILLPRPSGVPQASTRGTQPPLHVHVHHHHHPNHQAKAHTQPPPDRRHHGLRIDTGDKEPPTLAPSPRQSRPETISQQPAPRTRSYSRRRPIPPPPSAPPPSAQNGDQNPSDKTGRNGGSASRRTRRGSHREAEKHVRFAM